MDTLEIWFFSRLIDQPVNWAQAIILESMVSIAKTTAMVVPGALGFQESAIVGVGHFLGMPTSLTSVYAVFRRGRDLAFTLVGWALLWQEHPRWAELSQVAHRQEQS